MARYTYPPHRSSVARDDEEALGMLLRQSFAVMSESLEVLIETAWVILTRYLGGGALLVGERLVALAIELGDVVHSSESMMRLVETALGTSVDVERLVEEKNRIRGYYDE